MSDDWVIPVWCHQHAIKMQLDRKPILSHLVSVSNNAANLVINHLPGVGEEARWLMQWNIQHKGASKVSGQVIVSEPELLVAFGLISPEQVDLPLHEGMMKQYGAEAAVQEAFIRQRNFLNIPGPGTGHDGDPNISIGLTDEIKEAVQNLVERFGQTQPQVAI